MDNTKISVITVTYNCKDSVEKTIRSVISQTYSNIEYIMIDGGSSDGTTDLIEQYRGHISYFVSEKDRGIYDAMNKGITVASGDWVIFMNAGDFFADKSVLEEVSKMMSEDAMVVYGDIVKQCNGYYYYDTPAGVEKTSVRMPVFHQAAFVRLDYHKQHLFDIRFRSSGDYNFFHNAYLHDHVEFQYIPILVSCFDNRRGMSKDNHALSMRENLHIWKRDKDIVFRLKQEWQLFIYGRVIWIKRHLLKTSKVQELELKRLQKTGKKYVLGVFK